ncbi:MAG TPA: response regulator [Polyangiaceae bacterium]|jgi:two-component system chemotaxis response regulator CheY|nr:response regulator [Polyangiaceae bacterium]
MTRVLVVDDSTAMRSYVRAVLEDATDLPDPIEVVEAASGFDAMRLLPRGLYDLVITDINMPDINGLELIKLVRESERHREVAVLIISTQSAERDRARGLALGADLFLAKPFTPEALKAAVAATLSTRVAAHREER